MSHSPEPWRASEPPYGTAVFASDGREVAALCNNDDQDEVDMQRIVACVNACRWIPTEVLENEGLRNIIDLAGKIFAESLRTTGPSEVTHRELGHALKLLEGK